ncbi:unnamed protein product [Sphagnum balticum]
MLMAPLVLVSGAAHAWDCSYWKQSSNPQGECYVAPTQSGNSQTQQQGQGQSQTATGGSSTSNSSSTSSSRLSNSGNSTATGGTVADSGNSRSVSESSSTGGAGGNGGAGGKAVANQGNTQISQTYSAANVPNLGLPTQIIAGCGVSGSAGGANTKGAAILGVGFTTDECYAYIEAQAFWAIGDRQAACEILHTTNSAKRSIARGAHLPSCEPVPPQVIHEIEYVNNGPTEAEIELRIQHAIADYIETHPEKPCPKPHHKPHFQQTGCQMQVKVR